VFLALGVVFLFWAGRGLLAYVNGIHAAWSEPWVCVIGVVAGIGSLWVGLHLVRDAALARQFVVGRHRSEELTTIADQFARLEDTDPATAHKLLDDYSAREAAKTEARRVQLRERSSHDVEAAVMLRRELQDEIALNGDFRKTVLKKWPAEQRDSMLGEIDRTDQAYRDEIEKLDANIAKLRLR